MTNGGQTRSRGNCLSHFGGGWRKAGGAFGGAGARQQINPVGSSELHLGALARDSRSGQTNIELAPQTRNWQSYYKTHIHDHVDIGSFYRICICICRNNIIHTDLKGQRSHWYAA